MDFTIDARYDSASAEIKVGINDGSSNNAPVPDTELTLDQLDLREP